MDVFPHEARGTCASKQRNGKREYTKICHLVVVRDLGVKQAGSGRLGASVANTLGVRIMHTDPETAPGKPRDFTTDAPRLHYRVPETSLVGPETSPQSPHEFTTQASRLHYRGPETSPHKPRDFTTEAP